MDTGQAQQGHVRGCSHVGDHKMPWDYRPDSLEPLPWLLPACCLPTRWEPKHPQDWAHWKAQDKCVSLLFLEAGIPGM